MKSRVHPTYKTHYRVGNRLAYERALVSRGDVTLWLSPDARASWEVPPSGRPGGQQRFSDLAIETDGLRFHSTPAQQARDSLRDNAHAAAGTTPLRFTHAQVRYQRRYVEETLRRTGARLRPLVEP